MAIINRDKDTTAPPATAGDDKGKAKAKAAARRKPGRRPTLDVDERGLLIKHHLGAAAEALGLNPDAGAKLEPGAWAEAIDHYQRAEKLAGGAEALAAIK